MGMHHLADKLLRAQLYCCKDIFYSKNLLVVLWYAIYHAGDVILCNIGRAVVNLQHLRKAVAYCAGNFGIDVEDYLERLVMLCS